MREYRERDSDNARWEGFEFRPGDIIVDAPTKSGTTWTQLLVALLLFDGPQFPQPLGEMSIWMEQQTRSVEDAHAILAAQTHRRFIKSHTPLDGVPDREDVFYVWVGRDPRDAAVSFVHHLENMDRDRFEELITRQAGPEPEQPETPDTAELSRQERAARYFDRFIDDDADGPAWSLRFLAHHYSTFWERRSLPNVDLFHFVDYQADLPGQLARLADFLQVELSPVRARQLAEEASIERSRARAMDVAPEAHLGVWKDPQAFFRSGASGQWLDQLTDQQKQRYDQRMLDLVPEDLAAWIHGGRSGSAALT